MMCAVNRLFMVVFLLLVSEVALAQSISMNPSALRIEEDGQLNLEIRIRGNADEYEEPDLKDWRVVSSGSSSQTQIINGQFSRERVFTKVLEPLRTGILTIGKSVLYKNGQSVSVAKAIQIRVEPERGVGHNLGGRGHPIAATCGKRRLCASECLPGNALRRRAFRLELLSVLPERHEPLERESLFAQSGWVPRSGFTER